MAKTKEREEILAKANMLISSMELTPENYKLTGSNEELKEVLDTIIKDAEAAKNGEEDPAKDKVKAGEAEEDAEDEVPKPLTPAQLNAMNRQSYTTAMKNTEKLAMKAQMDSLRESDKK